MTNRGIDRFRPQLPPSSRQPFLDQPTSSPAQDPTDFFNSGSGSTGSGSTGSGSTLEAIPIHQLVISEPLWEAAIQAESEQAKPEQTEPGKETELEKSAKPENPIQPEQLELENHGDLDQNADLNQNTNLNQILRSPAVKTLLQRSRYRRVWQTTSTQLARGARVLGMPLVWVGVIAFCGGTGYAAFSWLSTIPDLPKCDRLWLLSSDADKLGCAEQAIRPGDANSLVAGLKLIQDWNSDHYLAKKATRLKGEWAKALMAIAQEKALHNQIDEASKLAQQISPDNPHYAEAKAAVLEWKNSRQRSQEMNKQVETALQAHDWKKAEAVLQTLATQKTSYWRQQQSHLRERIIAERIANNQLWQLRELVKNSPLQNGETMARAIALAQQIEPGSYTSTEAQEDVQRWTKSLVELTTQRLTQGDQAGAIATAQWIPQGATMPPNVQELVWLSQAQTLITSPPESSAGPDYLWQLTSTLAGLHSIPATSLLHAQAQRDASLLEAKIQDLTQLSLATAIASSQQILTLQLAIQMAQTITPDRPQRLYAQTLIASWQKDIQRAEDRPILALAQQQAQSKKIPDLQAAIAQASKIPLGRALRPEAQAAIFDWRQQIQTIEDMPFLEQSRKLAQQKRLPEAIQAATKIASGRALYPAAQRAIQEWTTTIQTAEDRPILDKARTLATQGDPSAAVRVAYQIAPDRALYDEAQQAIATWNQELEATRRRRSSSERDRPNDRDRPDDRRDDRRPYDPPGVR